MQLPERRAPQRPPFAHHAAIRPPSGGVNLPLRQPMTMREVLVVDDEHHILVLLTELLQNEGYRVRQAADGVAALREIDRLRPDLVLTDVMMPRLGGLELARQLRARKISTIVMSAAMGASTDASLVFLSKPFDLTTLVQLVASTLASSDGV
jgi:CheY-like chemotaxis protein